MVDETAQDIKYNHPSEGELYYNGAFPLDVKALRDHKIKSLYLVDHNVSLDTLKIIADYGDLTHLEFGVKAEGVSMPDGAAMILKGLDKIGVLVFRISNWTGSDFSFVSEIKTLHSLAIHPAITNYPAMNNDLAKSIAQSESLTSITLYMENIDNEIIRKIALTPKLTSLIIGGPIEGDQKARTADVLSVFGDIKIESLEVQLVR